MYWDGFWEDSAIINSLCWINKCQLFVCLYQAHYVLCGIIGKQLPVFVRCDVSIINHLHAEVLRKYKYASFSRQHWTLEELWWTRKEDEKSPFHKVAIITDDDLVTQGEYMYQWTNIGWDNGLSPVRRQAIIWTNARISLIQTLGTNFSECLSEIHTFSSRKMHLKMSSVKWRLICLGLNVLRVTYIRTLTDCITFIIRSNLTGNHV